MDKSYFSLLRNELNPLLHGLDLRHDAGQANLNYHSAVMRGDSELSTALREQIAAFVSGLNRCTFCCSAHTRVAEILGQDPGTTRALIDNVALAPVDGKHRVLFAYLRKLTLAPSVLEQRDVETVVEAGWSELALHDAINVACLFNMINRFVLGHGIAATDAEVEANARKLARVGYG